MGTEKVSVEQSFRDDLESVIAVVNGLKKVCSSLEELQDMLTLALQNDGQCRALILLVSQSQGKK